VLFRDRRALQYPIKTSRELDVGLSDQIDVDLAAERAALEDHYRAGGLDRLSSMISERIAQPAHSFTLLVKGRVRAACWRAGSADGLERNCRM